jgi:hypothetical protein
MGVRIQLEDQIMFDVNDNPYRAPVVSGMGEYDWTLAKRIFVAASALAIVYLLASAVGLWTSFRSDPNHRHEPVLATVAEFVGDWQDGNGLE